MRLHATIGASTKKERGSRHDAMTCPTFPKSVEMLSHTLEPKRSTGGRIGNWAIFLPEQLRMRFLPGKGPALLGNKVYNQFYG